MQGSATVAMISAAGMTAPILESTSTGATQLAPIVIAIATGASSLSPVNDSGFWLVHRHFGMTEKQTFRSRTVMTGLIDLTGIVIVITLSLIQG